MSLKNELIKLLNKIVEALENEENEFDVEFEDHELGNQEIYRLHYLNYHNINTGSFRECRGGIDWSFKPFILPVGMGREEAFKVLSYLTDFIEKNALVEEASLSSVRTLDSVIDLERFGFKRLDIQPIDDEIIDLFTVDGRIKRFKSSKYYPKYFNWYTENVSKEEVESIYEKCGFSFRDIVFSNTKNESIKVKQLTLKK